MKRFFQLRLRTFLVFVTVVCCGVGYVAANVHQYQTESEALERLGDRVRIYKTDKNGANNLRLMSFS